MLKEYEDTMQGIKGNIKITRDIFKKFISILIIILTIVLNGFLSFMTMGELNFELLKTTAFWLNYLLLLASEITILICFYVFRKAKNLKNAEITELNNSINEHRNKIYKLNLPKMVADWLRNYYNPREKINLFEDKILQIQEKLKLDEPFEPDKDDTKNYKKYLKLKKIYEKNLQIYNYTLQQLEFIDKFKTKLELQKKLLLNNNKLNNNEINTDEIKQQIFKIEEELGKSKFDYKKFKLKYDYIYWETLTANDYEENTNKRQSAVFHEKKLIANKLWSKILISLVITLIINTISLPIFQAIGLNVIIDLIMKLIMFLLSALSGIVLADVNILYYYKTSLEIRKTIYNEINSDFGISKIIIE